jgi:hypothetical protein
MVLQYLYKPSLPASNMPSSGQRIMCNMRRALRICRAHTHHLLPPSCWKQRSATMASLLSTSIACISAVDGVRGPASASLQLKHEAGLLVRPRAMRRCGSLICASAGTKGVRHWNTVRSYQ